jgi:hypothetical protein
MHHRKHDMQMLGSIVPNSHREKSSMQSMWATRQCKVEVAGAAKAFDVEAVDLITQCLTPDRTSPDLPSSTIFVLGDGHAAAILPALVLAVRGAFQVRHLYTETVGLFPHRVAQTTKRGAAQTNFFRYIDVYEHILDTLRARMQRGDVVVLSMHSGNWNPANGAIGKSHKDGSVVDLNSTAVDLMDHDLLHGVVEPAKAKLFVLGDWPYFKTFGLGSQPPRGNPAAIEPDLSLHAQLQAQLLPLLKSNKALHYASLAPLFCQQGTTLEHNSTTAPKGACSWNIPGTSIQAYSDDNHLNTVGSIYMWPHLCDMIEDLQHGRDGRDGHWPYS